MSPWHDVVDWAGGYPYEVAKPESVTSFLLSRGFMMDEVRIAKGIIRVNEFLFSRITP
jgi:2-polyprenyl-6-hydroxyphenyl methylase/3-demethylubiquinone-9 3-methyltransferase